MFISPTEYFTDKKWILLQLLLWILHVTIFVSFKPGGLDLVGSASGNASVDRSN